MQTDLINITLGFLEGFALIISPCILPILPIIFAGSLTGSKKRPFGIIIGFISAFALFTFFSRKLVQYTNIDLNLIRHLSFVILIALGVIMLSTYLTEKFSQITQQFSNTGSTLSTINDPQSGFMSGILFGGLTAIIWTPCAGPILAAVIVQTVIEKTNLLSFFILVAFATGAATPMLLITLCGRNVTMKFSFFKTHAILFRKLLGVVILLSVGYMIYLEGGISMVRASTESQNNAGSSLKNGIWSPYTAPAIRGISAWINSSPLQLDQLKGKVVLIDFWTYSCINCVRTLPYLNEWYRKYHDKGLVIIGVHTPEFDFEKNLDNVKRAVTQDHIHYPVALDNQYATWQNYNNQYWPAHYLIDKNGQVVYVHFGEGEYDVTENNILYLLGMNGPTTEVGDQSTSRSSTPETYLGYARAEYFYSEVPVRRDQSARYSFPEKKLSPNEWALQGNWKIMSDRIISDQHNAAIEIHFNARKVFVVMGNATEQTITVRILLNGKSLTAQQGKDVKNSVVHVDRHSIFEAVVLDQPESGLLQLIASQAGLEIYTFTFG